MLVECFCTVPAAELEDCVGVDASLDAGHDAGLVECSCCEHHWVEVCLDGHALEDG